MGVGLLYGLIILFVVLLTGIGLLIFSLRRKSKIGIVGSIIILLLVIFVLLTNTMDEFGMSKKDVISDLHYLNIDLKDDFEITKNKVTGMPERIQETEIQISQNDKDRIINEIKNSPNLKSGHEQFDTINRIFNYKYPEFYSRETYMKIDNYPTRLIVSIHDKGNIIKYQRIED